MINLKRRKRRPANDIKQLQNITVFREIIYESIK